MKNECSIVRDILPLYVEDMASPDTVEFIKEHLDHCSACRQEFDQIKKPDPIPPQMNLVPLKRLKKKMRAKRIQTVACTAILVIALLVSAFAFLSAPQFFPYSEDLISITENADGSITIVFDEKVTDCRTYVAEGSHETRSYDDSEDAYADREREVAHEWSGYDYYVEAWTSPWDRWFSNRGKQSITVEVQDGCSKVYYAQNLYEQFEDPYYDGDVLIYGGCEYSEPRGVSLPRLALNYYLVFAAIGFAMLLILWFVLKRKEKIRVWIERLMLYPVAYGLGHFGVMGIRSSTYSMQRDFFLIVLLSVILYCGLLLAHNLVRLRKERKEQEQNLNG